MALATCHREFHAEYALFGYLDKTSIRRATVRDDVQIVLFEKIRALFQKMRHAHGVAALLVAYKDKLQGEVGGDIAFIDGVSKEDKHRRELSAVLQILEPLSDKNRIIDLFNEFEERKTKEAQFAYLMDKIECDLQCKCYEENGNVSLDTEQKGVSESIRQDALEKGVKTFSEMWVGYEREKNVYRSSQLAKDITDYILSNKVFEKESDGKSDDKNGKNL